MLIQFLMLALLSWVDSHNRNPTECDLESFTDSVNAAVAKLALPSTMCDKATVRSFIDQVAMADISAVAAVVGGLLSQDVLNALGGKELPLRNWLIFDGTACKFTCIVS
jgi:ubiquitin-like 1-activating enzyme E1 A